MSLGSEAQEAL